MKTPGRRGEQIKNEEIDKEIIRRYTLEKEKEKRSQMRKIIPKLLAHAGPCPIIVQVPS
jgi:hypothetical protein